MTQILLTEYLSPDEANLVESITTDQSYFMSGILMQGDVQNGNGRIYDVGELSQVAENCTQKIKSGHLIMGQLNHPEHLNIDLDRVSHAITEMRVDGTNVVGKMKLLNTPCGNIARGILEGGVRLGVSSRGSGTVQPGGRVKDFTFLTVDVVSQPSAPNAYPDLVREALENKKIITLAEAMVHDEAAQKYLRTEIKKFMRSILEKK